MKKAGIITFFDHPNYGAVLQAYGMKCALEKLGCSVTFIRNTRDPGNAGNPGGAAGETERRLRVLEAVRHNRQKALRPLMRTISGFSEKHFRTEELDGCHDLNSGYDFFIAGSDQVWNIEITGLDPFWFLDFAMPEKRFSYAASFGMDCLPESCLPWYRERLAGFRNLSVREEAGRRIIRELTGREAAVCPDPVLLPERRVWEELMGPADKAVVLYMTEFDEDLYRYAKAEAAVRKIPLTVLGVNRLPIPDETTVSSPETWLGHIANAAVVYSNSFHALVFSHIFHKDLRLRPLIRMKNRNGRLFSFVESMGEALTEEENRPGLFRLKGSGDWEKADSRLDTLRQSGVACLRNIMDGPDTDVPQADDTSL